MNKLKSAAAFVVENHEVVIAVLCVIAGCCSGSIYELIAWLTAGMSALRSGLNRLEAKIERRKAIRLSGAIARVADSKTKFVREGDRIKEVEADRGWPEKKDGES